MTFSNLINKMKNMKFIIYLFIIYYVQKYCPPQKKIHFFIMRTFFFYIYIHIYITMYDQSINQSRKYKGTHFILWVADIGPQ